MQLSCQRGQVSSVAHAFVTACTLCLNNHLGPTMKVFFVPHIQMVHLLLAAVSLCRTHVKSKVTIMTSRRTYVHRMHLCVLPSAHLQPDERQGGCTGEAACSRR